MNERLKDYQSFYEELYCQETDLETYLSSYYGSTVEQMQAQWLEGLKNQVQTELVFAAMREQEKLTVDEAKYEAYIQSVLEANSGFFKDEASICKYFAAGNAEAGETYLKNLETVRDHFFADYDK